MAAQITLMPPEAFECSPSMEDGVSSALELRQRAYGCQLIQRAGVLLSLQAVTIASGQSIFHRFYFRRSLKSFDVRKIAASSLWLACKIEEDPRRVLHLVNVFHFLKRLEKHPEACSHLETMDKESLDPFILEIDSLGFKEFRAELIRCERYILRELGFMVSQTLVHPHRFILHYIHALFKSTPQVETSRLCQLAWGYINDSMMTILCCEVQPAVIAVGSIYLAANDLGIALPEDTRWYELFDVTWENVVRVCSTIRELYTWPSVEYVSLVVSDNDIKQSVKEEPFENLVKPEEGDIDSKDNVLSDQKLKSSPQNSDDGTTYDDIPKTKDNPDSPKIKSELNSNSDSNRIQNPVAGVTSVPKDSKLNSYSNIPKLQTSNSDNQTPNREIQNRSGPTTSLPSRRSGSNSLDPVVDYRSRKEQEGGLKTREINRNGERTGRSRDGHAMQTYHSPVNRNIRYRETSASPKRSSAGSPTYRVPNGDNSHNIRNTMQSNRVSRSGNGAYNRPSQKEPLDRGRGQQFFGGPGRAAGSDSRITFRPRAMRNDAGSRNNNITSRAEQQTHGNGRR